MKHHTFLGQLCLHPILFKRSLCPQRRKEKHKTKKLASEEIEEIMEVDIRNPTPLTEQLEPQQAADGRPVAESGNPGARLNEALTEEAARSRGT